MITWRRDGAGGRGNRSVEDSFSTIGVDTDQMAAAVIASEKMLNAVVTQKNPSPVKATRARVGGAKSGR